MTIQQWENNSSIETSPTRGVSRLVEWAAEADAAYQLANRLTSTAFCPEQFRGKPADAAAAMLAGGELGLSPLTALGAFDVIQGRAAARAITLRALTQARGHDVVLVESGPTRCKMKGRRANSSEWQTVTWTIDRARELNLTGKSNWKSQPQAMLMARATSELCRLLASDALLGIAGGYSSEEIADGGSYEQAVDTDTTTPAPTGGTRKMSRRPKPAAEDGTPERDEEGQKRAMFAAFSEASGFEHDPNSEAGRDERLSFISAVVGRDVESSNDLTWEERGKVIDALKDSAADSDDDYAAAVAAQDGATDA